MENLLRFPIALILSCIVACLFADTCLCGDTATSISLASISRTKNIAQVIAVGDIPRSSAAARRMVDQMYSATEMPRILILAIAPDEKVAMAFMNAVSPSDIEYSGWKRMVSSSESIKSLFYYIEICGVGKVYSISNANLIQYDILHDSSCRADAKKFFQDIGAMSYARLDPIALVGGETSSIVRWHVTLFSKLSQSTAPSDLVDNLQSIMRGEAGLTLELVMHKNGHFFQVPTFPALYPFDGLLKGCDRSCFEDSESESILCSARNGDVACK